MSQPCPHVVFIIIREIDLKSQYSEAIFLLPIWTRCYGNAGRENKSDYRKITNFCRAKGIIDKMERQPTEWENMFTNYIPVQGLIFKIGKEFIQLNIKTANNPTTTKNE